MVNLKHGLMIILCCCFMVLSFSLDCSASSCSPAKEKTYQVSESQILALESRLQKFKIINQENLKSFQNQQEKLRALEKKSLQLELNLNQQLLESKKQEELLQNVNQSFKAYEAQVKSKIRREKSQKIIWMTLAGALLYAYIRK